MGIREQILVVEGDAYVRQNILKILESAGFRAVGADSLAGGIDILDTEFVNLAIIDIKLPDASGFELMEYIKQAQPGVDAILLSAWGDVETATKAIEQGAYDFITKPFNVHHIVLAVQRAMEKRRLLLENRDLQASLEKKIREKALSLRLRNEEKLQHLNNTIMSLVQTLEAKDQYTEGHSRRVADTALRVAERLGLSRRAQEDIHLAGLFHDIGKIGIQESVLNKAGQLTPEEYEIIKKHVLIGVKILSQIPQFSRITPAVRSHHEFFDGSGYPDGVSGDEIPLGGRILAICDAYDAMTSNRSYRRKLSVDRACAILTRNRGTQFDPEIVPVFLRVIGYEEQAV
ncbi:MAG: response regulator [Deltaproteobacteria bacterium]|nr:response regulator [Deltaproteobacteria bacterium]